MLQLIGFFILRLTTDCICNTDFISYLLSCNFQLKGGVGSGPEAFRKLGLIEELQGLGKLPQLYVFKSLVTLNKSITRVKAHDA